MRSRTCRAFIALVWVIGISSPSFASQQQNSDPIPDISAMSFTADVNEGSVSLNFELVLSDNFSSSESLSLLFWFVGNEQTWINIPRSAPGESFTLQHFLHPMAASGTYEIRAVRLFDNAGLEIRLNTSQLEELGFSTSTILENPNSDSVPPALISLDSSGWIFNEVDEPILNVDIVALEEGSGLNGSRTILEVTSPTGSSLWSDFYFGDDNSASFSIKASKYAANGTYKINTVRMYDLAGNSQFSQSWLGENPQHFDLVNPNADDELPEIEEFYLSANFDNSSDRPVIVISGSASDNLSGVDGVYLRLNRPNGGILDKWIHSRGTELTLDFENYVALTTEFEPGSYTVNYLRLNDVAENEIHFNAEDLTNMESSLDTSVNVYFPSTSEVETGTTSVGASAAKDYVFGSNRSDDTLSAGDGDDLLYSGDGADTVNAGAGDDTIVGGSGGGDDQYDGGPGADTVSYVSTSLGVSVDLAQGIATGFEIDTDTLVSIENVLLGDGADVAVFSSYDNDVAGGSGDDSFVNSPIMGVDFANGGEGQDLFQWVGDSGIFKIEGGPGGDRFEILGGLSASNVEILDFNAMEGDIFLTQHILEVLRTERPDITSASKPMYAVSFDNGLATISILSEQGGQFDYSPIAKFQSDTPIDNLLSLVDSDNDGVDDFVDPDDDDDGVPDAEDAFLLDPTESIDSDLDGIGNNSDTDDDNDGVPDASDAFPTDPEEWSDSDRDGIGDNKDPDDNNDGVMDDYTDLPDGVIGIEMARTCPEGIEGCSRPLP